MITRLILIALFALTSFSCTRDPFDVARNPQSKTNVSLELEIPVSELVVTYSAADDAARESAIARLDIFAFDETGAIISGDEGHTVLTDINMVNGKGRATIPVTIPAGQTEVNRQFGIVANAIDISAMDGVTTLDEFRAMEFTQGSTIRTTHFMMSDLSALNVINVSNPSVKMSLRRTTARIDVVLQDEVTNFEITSVRLINVNTEGYLFGKNSNPSDLSSPIAIPTTSSLVHYDPVDATTNELKRNFSAQLYCLESYNGDKKDMAKTTAVIVGGILDGQTYYYRVNLHDNNLDAQLRRNYIYRVNIRRVSGVGNPDPAAAINDVPQNIDYTISEWDYSLHSDVIFDGKNYLGVSQSKFSRPKSEGSGSIDIVSNYTDSELKFESCDEMGVAIATPAWITYTKQGAKIAFAVKENTAADAAPRVAYINVSATNNSKLSLIVSVKQYHTDQTLVSFEPQIITATWNATSGVFKSKATVLTAKSRWSIEKLTLLGDQSTNWCRLRGATVVGSSGVTTADNQSFNIAFDLDQMNAALLSRTATVSIKITDPSGFEEVSTVTLTQSSISSVLTVSRQYIGKTAQENAEQITVNTTSDWTARFYTSNGTQNVEGCDWMSFTDQSYTPLGNPAQTNGNGLGVLYVKFAACPNNTVRNGYIVVRNGSVDQWIRVHQGDYRTVVIDGYEMLDRNLGATYAPASSGMVTTTASSATTHGYYYQWGRCPDGYETLSGAAAETFIVTADTPVSRQPLYGDAAWAKYITRGAAPTINVTTGIQTAKATDHHWLIPNPSYTPLSQRNVQKLWDKNGVASNTVSGVNLVSMRTEFDPCPDGWRVPTAREMENILKYGSKQLRPINGSETAANQGRFIATDNGSHVYFPTSNNRRVSSATTLNTPDAAFTTNTAGWYWTSSYSVEAGPYALRLYRSDIPDVLYTQRTGRTAPVVYPATTTAIDNMAGGHAMAIRCIRDLNINEELIVDTRRKTISNAAQHVKVDLTANNLTDVWTATSNVPWILVSPAAGTGSAQLNLQVENNHMSDVRQGAIRIRSTAGSVATITIVQLDESGVLVEAAGGIKRWWRSRNVGATRSDFVALNDDNVGYLYGWGANVPTRYEGVTVPVVSNTGVQSWNLATTHSGNSGNFPYPIKHPNNDPCPDGWRVPSYDELNSTYITGPPASRLTDVSANGWANNRKTGSGIWFPAVGFRSVNAVSVQGTYGYYWSSLDNNSSAAGGLVWITTSAAGLASSNPKAYGMPVRCVQETSDSFE